MRVESDHALAEIGAVLRQIDESAVEHACDRIAAARKIGLAGCGREKLQLQGFAMRLFHLGLNVGVVGDVAMPALTRGDLLIASAGPGELRTITTLMRAARGFGVEILFLTAAPTTPTASAATSVLHIPAQTMANDQSANANSVLLMGSAYEGALFFLFEVMVAKLRTRLGVTPATMRSRHTNME